MPLALMAVILAPLLLMPLRTAELWHEALEHERQQIAFDNAAIALGSGVRRALRALAAAEETLAAMEMAHHPLHACAQIKPPCRVPDIAAERAIAVFHGTAERAFSTALLAAVTAARVELGKSLRQARVEAPSVRLQTVRCAFCRLPVRWRVRVGDGAIVENAAPTRVRRVRWSGGGIRCNYRVAWNEGMAASSSK